MAEGRKTSHAGRYRFPTTLLILVLRAAGPESQARDALAALCRIYWYPLYGYVRRQGHRADEAQDLTQSFLARILEKQTLRDFRQERGRFRSFLLASLKNFLANQRDFAHAGKRGGDVPMVYLDIAIDSGERRYRLEPRDDVTPEKIFEKQWALALLGHVMTRLQNEFEEAGRGHWFHRLRSSLTGEDSTIRYRQLAQELDMTEGAVKVAIHRLRQRFRDTLREEISSIVIHEDEIGDEIRYLMSVIRA